MPFYTAEREPLKNHYKISDYEERYHREHDWFMPREPRTVYKEAKAEHGREWLCSCDFIYSMLCPTRSQGNWHVLKSPAIGVQVENEHSQNHLLAPLCLRFPSVKLRYHVPCAHGFQVLWARIISNNMYVQYLKLNPGVSVPSQYSCFTKYKKNWGNGGAGRGREKRKKKSALECKKEVD